MDKAQSCAAPLYGGQQILAVAAVTQVHRKANDWADMPTPQCRARVNRSVDVSDMQETGHLRATILCRVEQTHAAWPYAIPPRLRRASGAVCWRYTLGLLCGWPHPAQTTPCPVMDAGPQSYQCFSLPPSKRTRRPGVRSYQRLPGVIPAYLWQSSCSCRVSGRI